MNMEIRGLKLNINEALHDHIERRLRFALDRHAASIDHAVVRLEDVNGQRGGVDKQCRIRVVGRSAWQTYVSDTAEDLFTAVDRAAERVSRNVGRTLERRRAAHRGPGSAIRVQDGMRG